jgi:molecular chaperone DnaJ
MGQGVRSGPTSGAVRGADLRYRLDIDFNEAIFGTEKEISFQRLDTCTTCGGSGAEPGTKKVTCPKCNGQGELRQRAPIFNMLTVVTCDQCNGSGQVVETPCHTCRGDGRTRTTRRVNVTIPQGVDNGMQIRLRGEGEGGLRGGPPGDLMVVIQVRPHPLFQRSGDDVVLVLPINVAQAALGAELTVPTVDGDEPLTVPPGTQHEQVFRIRGKGSPRLRGGGRGDQLVVTQLVVPTDLTDRQRDLLEELAAEWGTEPLDKRDEGFFGKIKDALGF